MTSEVDCYLRYINSRFVGDNNISVGQEWLLGCIEFFLSQAPQISKENLYEEAFEQWLNNDLTEIGLRCLPSTVENNKNECMLNGIYPLQMQFLIDIAEPAYDQLRNLYNQKLDEPDEEPEQKRQNINISKKKRMLKLELTDGHALVVAMERSPISCLNTKLSPGCKILLKGPIRMVNKVLFLEPENVTILGGEVEKLLIENAFENVLLKTLGKPIKSNPQLEYQETVVQQNQQNRNVSNESSTSVVVNNPTTTADFLDGDDEIFSNLNTDSFTPSADKFSDDDDDIFLQANIPESVVISNQSNQHNNQRTSDEIFIDDNSLDIIDLTEIENDIQTEIRNEKERMSSTKTVQTTSERKPNIEFFDPDLDSMFPCDYTIDNDFENFSSDFTHSNYEFKISGCPLVTIAQLHSLDACDKFEKTFVVKCEIVEVTEKIRVERNQWKIGVLLKDSSGMLLQVQIRNEIIATLADTTAGEFQKMRSMIQQRPQIKDEMGEIFQRLVAKLSALESFMKVEYSRGNEIPVVTELFNDQKNFEEILKKKLRKGV